MPPRRTKNLVQKAAGVLTFLIFIHTAACAEQGDSTAPQVVMKEFRQVKAGKITCLPDSSRETRFEFIRNAAFNTSLSTLIQLLNNRTSHYHFWLKFNLENESDTILRLFLYCGDINFTDLYFVSAGRPDQHFEDGNLRRIKTGDSFIGSISPTIPLTLQPHQQGVVFIKLIQKTEEYDFDNIYIYDKPSLYQTLGEDFDGLHYFIIFQWLFQGILICQLLYVLFQWMIIRRIEYLYYFFYLLVISLYFLSKYERLFSINLLFSRLPLLTVYLNKTLLILPYFFYFRFVRFFLEMHRFYPVMNTWIIRIEKFLLVYLVLDLVFILTTFNVKLQREIYSYIILLVFIASAVFIFSLFREKKTLNYYILSGSLLAGAGNITGLILTYLDHENLADNFSNKLLFSQAGIILEIFCFTAGLGYKSMSAEKEKIKSQESLIEQLKANELLQNKMQQIRNNIAQDLHDDIGSTLSSMSILSNLAIKEHNEDRMLEAMHEINENSMTLMEKMDDIVWSINPRNDSLEMLLFRIKRFATRLFEAKNIDYSISIQENINEVKLPMEWRQHIYLILKEAINNLVKYAEATKSVLNATYLNGVLEITLEDNGRGFDSSGVFTGNGLLSMKKRAGEMQAELFIRSVPAQGTRVILRIKIK